MWNIKSNKNQFFMSDHGNYGWKHRKTLLSYLQILTLDQHTFVLCKQQKKLSK